MSKPSIYAFTLIEILVVATIIGLLAAGATISYTSLTKQSRDAKRKADLEQIRSALEMYRSNNNYYPNNYYPNGSNINDLVAPLTSGSSPYLHTLPTDPKSPYIYDYDALPSGCNNNPNNYCNDYTLGAKLESGGANCSGNNDDCESTSGTQSCNYCLGPYGKK